MTTTITGIKLGPKEQEIMDFLSEHVFNPALSSPTASNSVKTGVRYTIMRLEQRATASAMRDYFWSAIEGTEKSIRFADLMAEAKLVRFEEVLEEFRRRFTDEWLRS
jgi:hypothetical protein